MRMMMKRINYDNYILTMLRLLLMFNRYCSYDVGYSCGLTHFDMFCHTCFETVGDLSL